MITGTINNITPDSASLPNCIANYVATIYGNDLEKERRTDRENLNKNKTKKWRQKSNVK